MMEIAQVFLAAAGAALLTVGTVHGLLTLRDVKRPKAFTPTDPAVRAAMQGAQLAFNPRMNLWRSWLGFNLSHSLGLVMFGGALLFVAFEDLAAFKASGLFQAAMVLGAAAYFVVSIRFWFWGPALGTGLVLLSILAAVLL